VQLCLGSVDSAGQLVQTEIQAMESIRTEAHGHHVYRATGVACRRSGRQGVTVRVLPCHPDLAGQLVPALIAWA
jgi:starch phosphorylase